VSVIPSGLNQPAPAVTRDAWMVTISALETLADRNGKPDIEPMRSNAAQRPAKSRRKASGDDVPARHLSHAAVTLVERVTDRSILVNWCDSTSCHYCDQLWTRRSARRSGHCALTGDLIARGDVVYAPYTRVSNPPANERAMILASSVQD
jgi:hypothetical protein